MLDPAKVAYVKDMYRNIKDPNSWSQEGLSKEIAGRDWDQPLAKMFITAFNAGREHQFQLLREMAEHVKNMPN